MASREESIDYSTDSEAIETEIEYDCKSKDHLTRAIKMTHTKAKQRKFTLTSRWEVKRGQHITSGNLNKANK